MVGKNDNTTSRIFGQKVMMTFVECAAYLGVSKGYLYRLTMARRIPYYKPNGKNIYFDKAEVDEWLHRNRVAPSDELTAAANEFCKRNNLRQTTS